jgi:hypothetical protein
MKRYVFVLGIVLAVSVVGALLADLPTPVPAVVRAPGENQRVAQVGVASPWTTLVSNAGSVDNSGNPVLTLAQVEAVHPTSVRYETEGLGSHLIVRLKYESALTVTVNPIVEVLAMDAAGKLSKLRNINGDVTGTLATSTADVTAGIYDYTTPNDAATFALNGAQHVVVAIKTALAGTGTVTTSAIEGRVISPPSAGSDAVGSALLTSILADAVSINTQTRPFITSGGGGYVRQDSTATIAKESGGNLAALLASSGTIVSNAVSINAATLPFLASGGGGYMRQDSTASIAKETGGMLAAATTAVQAKVCATALSSVTTATWTAIPSGGQTYLVINAVSATSGNAATMTVWGSPDGGTTQRVLLRADTLAPAKSVAIAVGTVVAPNATTYTDAFAVLRAGCTHVYLAESAPNTNNFTYGIAGF